MKGLLSFTLLFILFSFTKAGKEVKIVDLNGLESHCRKENDTLYVVNFWATWCKPCVAEMPFFFEAAQKFSNKKVRVLFASLNSMKELPHVQEFVVKKSIKQPVFLLHAGNPNVWIDKVDSSWGGSIPATVMYRKHHKVFFREGDFTSTELDSIINQKIK